MKQGALNMIHIDHVYTVKKLVQKVRDYYFNENDSVKLDFDQISADYWNHILCVIHILMYIYI